MMHIKKKKCRKINGLGGAWVVVYTCKTAVYKLKYKHTSKESIFLIYSYTKKDSPLVCLKNNPLFLLNFYGV
jgi:hypothetical protein